MSAQHAGIALQRPRPGFHVNNWKNNFIHICKAFGNRDESTTQRQENYFHLPSFNAVRMCGECLQWRMIYELSPKVNLWQKLKTFEAMPDNPLTRVKVLRHTFVVLVRGAMRHTNSLSNLRFSFHLSRQQYRKPVVPFPFKYFSFIRLNFGTVLVELVIDCDNDSHTHQLLCCSWCNATLKPNIESTSPSWRI